MLFVVLIIWFFYCITEGIRGGYYHHYKSIDDVKDYKYEHEIHPIFTFQRIMVLFLLCFMFFSSSIMLMGLSVGIGSIKTTILMLSLMLLFNFIHNGVYYIIRNTLENTTYPLKWREQSKPSKIKGSKLLSFKNRTIMFIIGLIGILLIVII